MIDLHLKEINKKYFLKVSVLDSGKLVHLINTPIFREFENEGEKDDFLQEMFLKHFSSANIILLGMKDGELVNINDLETKTIKLEVVRNINIK